MKRKVGASFIALLLISFLYQNLAFSTSQFEYSVDRLYHSSKSVTGNAQTNTKVIVYLGTKQLGETSAKDRRYSFSVSRLQIGSIIKVKFVDSKGNIVASRSTTVVDASVKTESDYQKIKVNWSRVPRAEGYEIYRSNTYNGSYTRIGKVSGGNTLSYTDTKTKTGNKYYYRIRAFYTMEGQTVFGPYSKKGRGDAVLSVPVNVSAKKVNITSLVLGWNKVEGASGFRIYRSTSLNGKYSTVGMVSSGSTLQFTDKELDINQTYYYKVKAYRTVGSGKIYSKYSSVYKQHMPKFNRNSILLVDKQNGLEKDYVPKDLVIPNVRFSTTITERKKMTKDAGHALEKMFTEASKKGVVLYAQSGYRSYATQASIYQSNVNRYGQRKADTFSARPGHSEHQTGLAMDVTSKSINYQLIERFADTKEGQWIKKNASKYGFIISYPKGKTTITGYVYEPWHIRYVGVEHAMFMDKHEVTLKEYLDRYGY